jgi:predicted nuclease with TOPRIM domain
MCSVTSSLQEKEAALKEHINSSSQATSALLKQLEEAKAAQHTMQQQLEKLEAAQVWCVLAPTVHALHTRMFLLARTFCSALHPCVQSVGSHGVSCVPAPAT